MIKIMLVGGDRVEKLSSFLNSKEAIKIEYGCASLSNSLDAIKKKYINVDKLVYLYYNSSVNIREDMKALQYLLTNDRALFIVPEIIFISRDGEDTEYGLEFFKAIISKIDGIKVSFGSAKEITFPMVYNTIMGNSKRAKINNGIRKQYHVERGSEILDVYEPEHTEDTIIEIFSNKKLNLYKEAKDLAKVTVNSSTIYDTTDNTNIIEKFDNPDLGQIHMQEFKERKNIFVVSGMSKSGNTILATSLTLSATDEINDKTICYVNLTDSQDYKLYFEDAQLNYRNYDLKELLMESKLGHRENTMVIDLADKEESSKMSALRYITNSLEKIDSHAIIIDVDLNLLEMVTVMIGVRLNKVFLNVENIKPEILKLKKSFGKLVGNFEVMVNLREQGNFYLFKNNRLSGEESKELLTDKFKNVNSFKICKPFDFMELEDELYDFFMGVK